jgi:hypothetical protein
MNNISRLFLTLSVAGLIGALCAPTAQADDKVYPASMCVKVFATGTVEYNASGRIFNPSSNSAVTVLCPIVRDNTTAPWTTIEVVVFDQHPNLNVSCTAFSFRRDGVAANSIVRTSAGSSTNAQTLSFGSVAEFDRGYFFLRCVIPQSAPTSGALSGIASYFIQEP